MQTLRKVLLCGIVKQDPMEEVGLGVKVTGGGWGG